MAGDLLDSPVEWLGLSGLFEDRIFGLLAAVVGIRTGFALFFAPLSGLFIAMRCVR